MSEFDPTEQGCKAVCEEIGWLQDSLSTHFYLTDFKKYKTKWNTEAGDWRELFDAEVADEMFECPDCEGEGDGLGCDLGGHIISCETCKGDGEVSGLTLLEMEQSK